MSIGNKRALALMFISPLFFTKRKLRLKAECGVILMRHTYWSLFVCSITHTFIHVFTMMHAALIPVFIKEFGLSIFEAGMLVSIPQALSVSISLPYGVIIDRMDPRKLIALSLLMSGFGGLAVSQAGGFLTLLLPLSFIPLSSMVYHPPALTIVSELFPERKRSKILGIHAVGGTMGVAIGPITLGLILENFGWRFSYLVWCIPVLLSALLLPSLPGVRPAAHKEMLAEEDSGVADESIGSSSKMIKRGFTLLLLAMGINSIGQQALSAYMTVYFVSMRSLSESSASLLYGISPFVGILGSLIGGFLGDRLGNRRWISAAYMGRIFVYTGIWLGPLWMLVAVYLMGGFFGVSTLGPLTSLVARFSPKRRRGLAYVIFMVFPSLMGSISPLIAAKLIEAYNINGLFPFAIILTSISILLLQKII